MSAQAQSACAYVLMTNVDPEKWRGKITREAAVIGRDPTAGIRIPDQFCYVSRNHAKVWADQKGLWIHDLGSSSSTAVNGILLEPHKDYRLAVRDRIWLGGMELEVVSTEEAEKPDIRRQEHRKKSLSETDQIDLKARTKEIPCTVALKQLSHAELEILLWMRRGLSTFEELAEKLHRSPNTIRTQMASIFKKMEVHTRHELFAKFDRKRGDSAVTSVLSGRR